jgi:hypothetical protein
LQYGQKAQGNKFISQIKRVFHLINTYFCFENAFEWIQFTEEYRLYFGTLFEITRQIQNKILSATISPEEDCVSFTLLIQNSTQIQLKVPLKSM